MKLDAPASPAPAAPTTEPADDAGFDGLGDTEPASEPAPADDKPFDDEPFDAGVEADEDTDPKKYIEQLTGKLGQSLRKYTEQQGQPDFELEKFAINSLLSATHTSEMDEEDRKDIIKKVNTAGDNDSEDSDMGDSNDSPDNTDDSNDGTGSGDGADVEFGSEEGEENLDELRVYENEDLFLKEPKKMSIFAPEGSAEFMEENRLDEQVDAETYRILELIGKLKNSNREVTPENVVMLSLATVGGTVTDENKIAKVISSTPVSKMVAENLINSEKNRIFGKDYITSKLQESFNQEDMKNAEPQTAPAPVKTPVVKPGETKPVQPSRKNKPFLPMPEVQPDPKAVNEGKFDYEVYHKTLSGCFNEAVNYVIKRGYDPIEFELSDPQHISYGQTQRYTKELTVNGKLQRKAFHAQIYRMDSGNYELNMYIN
ncbi:MAG: hypothetical protein E6R13_05835 [Spirochaetes bacterium]|nr:MAG: hypothetical protein E6R13_05835 [Spirochaetota bacterium]